jgi:hypothetical protein
VIAQGGTGALLRFAAAAGSTTPIDRAELSGYLSGRIIDILPRISTSSARQW